MRGQTAHRAGNRIDLSPSPLEFAILRLFREFIFVNVRRSVPVDRWIWHGLRVLLLGLVLTGCASVGTDPQQTDATQPEAQTAVPATGRAKPVPPPEYPVRPFGEATFFELLAAEVAADRGNLLEDRAHLVEALRRFVEQANATRDPGVVARATRLAFHLRDSEALGPMAKLWVEIEPDSLAARQIAVFVTQQEGDLVTSVRHMEAIRRLGGLANFEAFAYRGIGMDEAERELLLTTIGGLLEDYPGDVQLKFAKALLLEMNERYEDALVLVDEMIAAETTTNAIILKVDILMGLERTEEATDLLGAAVDETTDDKRLRLAYARFLYQIERLDDARAQYLVVLETNADDGDVLFALALIGLAQEKDNVAADYLSRMVRYGKRTDQAHYYLGGIAEREADTQRAISEYSRVAPGPTFILASARIAALMVDQGRLDEARQQLANLRKEYPDANDQIVLVEAELLNERGMSQEALALIDEFIDRDPDNIPLLYSRAITGEKIGDLSILERDLKRIIELQPNNADAMNALGYTLTDQTDRHEEALALIERALALRPGEAAFIDSMGWVQFRLRNYEEALVHLRRALELFPNDEVAGHLGEVLWMADRKDEARAVWDQALELAPDSVKLKAVLDRLTR